MKDRRKRDAKPLRQFFRQQKYLLLRLHRSLRATPSKPKSHKFAKNYVKQSIDRVVQETNPHIRIVDGYYKALKKHIEYPLQLVDALVAKLQGITEFSEQALNDNGLCAALFYDSEKIHKVITSTSAYKDFIKSNPAKQFQPVYGLLTVKLQEQVVFKPALQNGKVVNDVRHEQISMNNPRIVFVCEDTEVLEQELKSYLLRRLLNETKLQLDNRLITGYQQARQAPTELEAPLTPPEYLNKLCETLTNADKIMYLSHHSIATDSYGFVGHQGEIERQFDCWQLHVNEQEPRIVVPFYFPGESG